MIKWQPQLLVDWFGLFNSPFWLKALRYARGARPPEILVASFSVSGKSVDACPEGAAFVYPGRGQ
jgi:hypothetical protein